jgi:3-oxoacyl-[acyl-carrier protein] reductase
MRTALVTGASRGIGHGIAQSLARQGYGLTITSRSEADLEALAAELRDTGAPRVAYGAADMADRAGLDGIVDLHRKAFGSMNALILNAGVGSAGTVETFRMNRFDKVVQINVGSALMLVKHALPLLRTAAGTDRARGAKVIGLSSITGEYAEPGLAVYGATKAALISLMESLNVEESANGVTATAIAPGWVDTDMADWIKDSIPAETMIGVDDVVAIVDALLSLSRRTSITKIVMSRSGTNGYSA